MKSMLLALAAAAALALPAVAQQSPKLVAAVPQSTPPAGVTEHEITLGIPPWQIGATVTMPAGHGPFPAVIFIHGSGPGRRDMHVGGSYIFRDLAWGLAKHGIASLRYDKRTLVHGDLFEAQKRRATLEEEFIEDATRGALALQSTAGVDPSRVFILGHSQGAGFASLVGNNVGAAGAILVSGSDRGAIEVLKQQAQYYSELAKSDPSQKEVAQTVLHGTEQLEEISSLAPDTPILGQPAWYWHSMLQEPALPSIDDLLRRGGRILLVQGGRDYLVTDDDWKAWHKTFDGRSGVTFKYYSDLNHLMQSGVGKMTPAEYAWTRPVSQHVIDDIAQWILAP